MPSFSYQILVWFDLMESSQWPNHSWYCWQKSLKIQTDLKMVWCCDHSGYECRVFTWILCQQASHHDKLWSGVVIDSEKECNEASLDMITIHCDGFLLHCVYGVIDYVVNDSLQ